MITFRKAELNDSPAISNLVNSAYRGEEAKLGWTTEADILDGQRTDPDLIREIIENENSQIQLAFQNNSLVGSILLVNEKDSLYFGMLTVNPKLQNQGIGKKLLMQAESIARDRGYRKMRMTVIRGRQELMSYYERFGYRKTGNVEKFPEDPRYGIPKGEIPVLEEFIKVLSE